MIFWSGSNQGPVVLPGTYTVRLTAGDARTPTLAVRAASVVATCFR